MVRILVVDDDADLREELVDALRDAGHTVVGASNGQEALDRLDEEPVQVVITDIVMPEMDGIELIRALAERAERAGPVGIIAMTGGMAIGAGQSAEGRRVLANAAGLYGAFKTLEKPFRLPDLMATLDEVLAGS